MVEQSNKPEIRFNGFLESWENNRLGDIMDVTSVKRIHQSDWTTKGVRFLRARDIVSIYKGENQTDLLYISEEKYNEYSTISGKVKRGDLLVTGVGTIGVPLLITNDNPLYFKDGNIIWFKNSNVIVGDFLYYSFISEYIQNFINEAAGIGTVGTYTIDSGKKTPILLPKQKDEQIKLGDYFKSLDKDIILQQRKLDKLKIIKKSMLEKMFPKDGSDVPEIRFHGFSRAWKQDEYSNLFKKISNNSLSRAELNYEQGNAKNLHYGDILVKFGEVLDLKTEKLPYISDENIVEKYKSSHLLDGDIIIADAAEDETVGKCTEVVNIEKNVLLAGLHTIAIRPLVKFAPMYLGYFMNTQVYQDQLLRLIQGSKVSSISHTALQNTQVLFPIDELEQSKIANYFKKLDRLITLQQKELEKLKQFKSSCLDKMFV